MRINNVGPQVVVAPEVRAALDEVRATQPITAQTAAVYSGSRPIVEPMAPQPAPAPVQERRHGSRRAEERRKQQIPVLIDTRVSERRVQSRRADDGPPPSIDVAV